MTLRFFVSLIYKQKHMKQLLLLSAFLLAACTGFAQTSKKRLIDTAEVKAAELVKVNFSESEKSQKKFLTKKQYNDFAVRWNASKPVGADKYEMRYYVYLNLKDDSQRKFTIAGSQVQEQNWMTHDIGDRSYFDKLWAASR